jgi:hypothetical protein
MTQRYQQRVIDERAELDAKLFRLNEFLDNRPTISNTELDNLVKQMKIMQDYLDILDDRIEWFNS